MTVRLMTVRAGLLLGSMLTVLAFAPGLQTAFTNIGSQITSTQGSISR